MPMYSETLPGNAAPELPDWFSRAMAEPGQSRFFDTDENRLHYLGWNLEDEHKPILLFIHGFRGHAHWWDFIAPSFVSQFRVVALDLSGMGDSGHREAYDAVAPAQDILALIKHLGSTPVIAVGHSYGGSRLLRACSERPALFQRLIIIDSFVLFEGEPFPAEPATIRGNRVYPDLSTGMQRFRLMPEQPITHDYLLEHVARHSLRPCHGGYRWKFDPTLPVGGSREADGESLLRSIRCRVDYISAEKSVVVSQQRATRIVTHLADGHGPVVVPEGHHHLMFDQPLALISVLRALLA